MSQYNFNFSVVIVKKKVKGKDEINFNKSYLTPIFQMLFAACSNIVQVPSYIVARNVGNSAFILYLILHHN